MREDAKPNRWSLQLQKAPDDSSALFLRSLGMKYDPAKLKKEIAILKRHGSPEILRLYGIEENIKVHRNFDTVPYANVKLSDVARILDAESRRTNLNGPLVMKLIERLITSLSHAVLAVEGRPEWMRVVSQLSRAFSSILNRLPALGMQDESLAAQIANSLAPLEHLHEAREKRLALFSLRWGVSYGWHWKRERDVLPSTAEQWTEVFLRDEPGTHFVVMSERDGKKTDRSLKKAKQAAKRLGLKAPRVTT